MLEALWERFIFIWPTDCSIVEAYSTQAGGPLVLEACENLVHVFRSNGMPPGVGVRERSVECQSADPGLKIRPPQLD